jgi:hypothetical protein
VRRLVGLAAVVLCLPLAASALEPRFDHRDEQGLLVAIEGWRETEAVSRKVTQSDWHPRLRLGYSFDVSGEGDELILGGSTRLDGYSDPERQRNLIALDARYRGYFGTEELKTFFEVGLWTQLLSRFSVGPQVGLGLAYDPSRAFGGFVSVGFQAGVGQAQVASFGASAGVQLRF